MLMYISHLCGWQRFALPAPSARCVLKTLQQVHVHTRMISSPLSLDCNIAQFAFTRRPLWSKRVCVCFRECLLWFRVQPSKKVTNHFSLVAFFCFISFFSVFVCHFTARDDVTCRTRRPHVEEQKAAAQQPVRLTVKPRSCRSVRHVSPVVPWC